MRASRGTRASTRRRWLSLLASVALLAVLVLLSISIGSKSLDLGQIVEGVTSPASDAGLVIYELRIPRTVLAILAGVALGVSGALIQALTRNPLADPGILGVNAGSSFAVVLAIAVFGLTSIHQYLWFAFAGALVVSVVVYTIGAAGRGGTTPVRMTLAGVGLGAVLSGIASGLALVNPRAFDQLRNWNAGAVTGRPLDVSIAVLPFIVLGVVLAAVAARELNAVSLGDDLARSLGARLVRTRIVVVIAVALLAGAATAAAGPIGFVGLMIPHVSRWIAGPDQRWILVLSCFLAPSLLLAADLIGRVVLRPAELPVGIVTAFVGAPILILLVRRAKASTL